MSHTTGIDHPSRSSAADDDGTDHIGSDTPRSGVATPQPDLHDKRLPGIMSYFQVRAASFKNLLSGSSTPPSRPPSAAAPSNASSSSAVPPPTAAAAAASSSSVVVPAKPAVVVAAASTAPKPSVPPSPRSEQHHQPSAAPAPAPALAARLESPLSRTLPQPAAASLSLPASQPSPAPCPASASTSYVAPQSTPSAQSAQSAQPAQPSPLSQMVPSSPNGIDTPPFLPHEVADQQPPPRPPQLTKAPISAQLKSFLISHANTNSVPSPPLVTLPSHDTPSASGPDMASPSSLHPYPTPPGSIAGSGGPRDNKTRNDSGFGGGLGDAETANDGDKISVKKKTRTGWGEGGAAAGSTGPVSERDRWNAPWSFSHKKSISDVADVRSRPGSPSNTPLAGVVTPSSVHARHFSIPFIPTIILPPSSTSSASTPTALLSPTTGGGSSKASTGPSTPARADSPALAATAKCASAADHVRKLTPLTKKSGHSTPTRSMSTAQSANATPRMSVATPSDNYGAGMATPSGLSRSRAASITPTPQGGAQAPMPKGRMTIKISEARGLRRTKDPYVVAVFQRSELISSGPRPAEEDSEATMPSAGLASIAIQRQASDNGRPMAIPMRSRQSSNTSLSDFSTFRNRNGRRSLTNPKWDAEAVFDVVDSNMLVDISVYDHSPTGEEFLGHVDFQANSSEKDGAVRGWFPLRGHADTNADNAPTGEIFVEAFYQGTEKKHYGPDDFEILRLIGKGTFGQVYQVRKKDTRRIYAMKVLSKKKIVQKKEVAHTVGERNILVRTATSDSPFIVGLKFSFQTPSDLYLVTDYMSGGELFWHLQKEGRFEESRAKFYIAELILAIEHLHNNNIVYRDLKPENILLDANGHIALCDFGLSKANLTKNDTTNTFCGTTEYLAPEVLLDEAGYTKMVDFWSLGVLVFEMCCGWSPFYAEDTQQMYKNIAFGKVRFPKETLSAEGRSFVKGLLNRNPKHRLGATKDAAELMEHPFFRDIDWTALSKKLITPPFKPKLKSDTDVSYFDPIFTDAMDKSGSLNERAAALAHGLATSTPLSPSMQANFQGFTFVDESSLDDNFRGRQSYNNHFDDFDDDMHDAAHPARRDDGDAQMGGVVRTATADEPMFGGSHFDM